MKRIEAVIRPHKQGYVLSALAKLGITNVTVTKTLGNCDPPNYSQIYDPASVDPVSGTGLVPKRLLLLFVEDDQVPAGRATASSPSRHWIRSCASGPKRKFNPRPAPACRRPLSSFLSSASN